MKVFIGIPTITGQVTAEIAEALFRLARWTEKENGFSFSLYLLGGIYPRPYARNLLAKEFLASDADYLWWLDADMAPNGSIVRLFEEAALNWTSYDIFTCYTLSITNAKPGLAVPLIPPAFKKELPDGQMELELNAVQGELKACGFGSTLLSKRVVADQSLWASLEVDRDGVPGVFADTSEPSSRCKQSEDTHFTQRASRAGYKILYVPSAIVGHYKTLNLLEAMSWGENCFAEGVKIGGEGWKKDAE